MTKYELRCLDSQVGSRYFSTGEERQAFIGRSFTDLTIDYLDPPEQEKVTHPLARLIGQRLAETDSSHGYDDLLWGANGYLRIYAQARIQDAAGQIRWGEPGYQDRLAALAGRTLVSVDELLDRGLVLIFTHDVELVIPLDRNSTTDGDEAAESVRGSHWMIWIAGEPPFE